MQFSDLLKKILKFINDKVYFVYTIYILFFINFMIFFYLSVTVYITIFD